MIKPDSYQNIGKIIDAVTNQGFSICKLKMSKFSKATAERFYAEHVGKPFFEGLQNFMTSDVCVGMELVENGGINRWR